MEISALSGVEQGPGVGVLQLGAWLLSLPGLCDTGGTFSLLVGDSSSSVAAVTGDISSSFSPGLGSAPPDHPERSSWVLLRLWTSRGREETWMRLKHNACPQSRDTGSLVWRLGTGMRSKFPSPILDQGPGLVVTTVLRTLLALPIGPVTWMGQSLVIP